MSSLDEMTKEELLDYARERGISPANQAMSKAEIRESIDATTGGDEPTVDPQITTTMTKDYLNRALVNAVPGTSNATDYLGRSVIASNKDYLARSLVA